MLPSGFSSTMWRKPINLLLDLRLQFDIDKCPASNARHWTKWPIEELEQHRNDFPIPIPCLDSADDYYSLTHWVLGTYRLHQAKKYITMQVNSFSSFIRIFFSKKINFYNRQGERRMQTQKNFLVFWNFMTWCAKDQRNWPFLSGTWQSQLKIGMKKSMERKNTPLLLTLTHFLIPFFFSKRFPPSGLLCVYCKLPSCHRSALTDAFDKHVSMHTIMMFVACLTIFHWR